MLLVAAGLLTKSLRNMQSVSLGFDVEGALSISTFPLGSRYQDFAQRADFYRRFHERLAALPGVAAVGGVSFLPFGSGWSSSEYHIQGLTDGSDELPTLENAVVLPGYFATMGIPILHGRAFDATDGQHVVVVNERVALRYWPGTEAIGKQIGIGDRPGVQWAIVVGVVGDVRFHELSAEPEPKVYFPYAESEWPFAMQTVLRTSGDPLQYASLVRQALREIDPVPPIATIEPLSARISRLFAEPRFNAFLLGALTVAAVLLAGLGLYGVISFSVAQRTHEIGIRIAVGGSRTDVVRQVLWRGMRLTMVGVATGLIAATAVNRLMVGTLYGVSATDPVTLLGAAILLTAVTTVATYIPAHRASKVDPLVALRQE